MMTDYDNSNNNMHIIVVTATTTPLSAQELNAETNHVVHSYNNVTSDR